MHSNNYGDTKTTQTRPRFNPPGLKLNVEHSTLDTWVKKLKAEREGWLNTVM